MEFSHKPVLLEECIKGLNIKPKGTYIDGTLGGAGHSIQILKRLEKNGLLIGIDKDTEALEASQEKLKDFNNIKFIHGNHDDIKEILESLHINKVDGILLDLGVSSYQLDEKSRGFSYLGNEVLDMRMDKSNEIDAKYILNHYEEEKLSKMIYQYGEERFARNIARNICEYRKSKELQTTKELVDIIERSIPQKEKKYGHVAKKTFQAIRIEVNNELEPLQNTIIDCINVLNTKGRLVVITFHSLEDRIVKNTFLKMKGKCICPSDLPYCACGYESYGDLVNKKPIIALKKEQEQNPRSKSAKLRIFERD